MNSDALLKSINRKNLFEDEDRYADASFATRSIEVGNESGRSAVPIFASVTAEVMYARHGDPTRDALMKNIASLEGSKYALVTSSGMAAVSLALFSQLEAGDRILCHRDTYIWTEYLLRADLPRLCRCETSFVDMTSLECVEAELKKGKTKIVYIETIANPLLHVVDIEACCRLAHRYGAKIFVDNTFASPYLCRPIEYGCDVVLESMTKYINGHGDALGGAVCTNDPDLFDACVNMMATIGSCLSPFNSYLILRGIQTLSLRVEKHCDNAEALVHYLSGKKHVHNLTYPGLASHPQHDVAARQFKRFGGMLGFTLDMNHETLHEVFLKELKLFKHWVSLGEGHTLISPKDEDREKGIPRDFIRVSAGLENSEDLVADLERGFRKVFGGS